ncbi:ABC transporter ATP-binding protein [Halosolutus gelatinilyticus]|uniref:ABC transporter ATP-binding protein n=1 Tax=Halosolutus gelatinilyticus TaxID=2931975 RepID=UPI001FF66958|nr:ABC transporter ATP-binding protein [Halosolutus gelatinilyticus]
MIEIRGLTKRYGDFVAVDDLDLCVERGEIYGFLGQNGAGKSTTINVLLDFIRPTSGEVRVIGYDPLQESLAVRQRTGVLPEGFDLYNRLSGREHLAFVIESKAADETPEEIAARVGIADALDRPVGGYSKGMKQRLGLGAALIGAPDLLILDEPSSGLDPGGAREMREIVREEADRGATVFFSSHVLEQVEAVCDRVGILRDGRLVAEDTVEGLRETTGTEVTFEIEVDRVPTGVASAIGALPGISEVTTTRSSVTVRCRDDSKMTVLNELEAAGATIRDFDLDEASLEELFMAYAYTNGDDEGTANSAKDEPIGIEAGNREDYR